MWWNLVIYVKSKHSMSVPHFWVDLQSCFTDRMIMNGFWKSEYKKTVASLVKRNETSELQLLYICLKIVSNLKEKCLNWD